jgi:hypothetical protein
MPNDNGYHIPHLDDRAHGGAAVIIRSAISHHELIHHRNKKFQAASVKVDLKPWSLTLSAVYCPPRHTRSSAEYVELLESYGSKCLIGGDRNAKHSQWGARLITPKGRNLLEPLKNKTANTSPPANQRIGQAIITTIPTLVTNTTNSNSFHTYIEDHINMNIK